MDDDRQEIGRRNMKKIIILFALSIFVICGYSLASEKVVYYCPKCGSENVIVYSTWKPPEPKIIRKSMDEISVEQSWSTTTLEVKYYPAECKCNDCGYIKKFLTTWGVSPKLFQE
jgi:Zn finger protein HypA/HybF involved in hydrogenase expression